MEMFGEGKTKGAGVAWEKFVITPFWIREYIPFGKTI